MTHKPLWEGEARAGSVEWVVQRDRPHNPSRANDHHPHWKQLGVAVGGSPAQSRRSNFKPLPDFPSHDWDIYLDRRAEGRESLFRHRYPTLPPPGKSWSSVGIIVALSWLKPHLKFPGRMRSPVCVQASVSRPSYILRFYMRRRCATRLGCQLYWLEHRSDVFGVEDGQGWVVLLRGIVLGKELVVVGVHDGFRWVFSSQRQGSRLTISVVDGTTALGPVESRTDECSGLGIGTGVGGTPEARADPDLSKLVGF